MKALITDIDQNFAAWREAHTGKLSASEFPVLLGLSKYKSRTQLWAEKRGLVPAFEGNELTDMGTHIEPMIGKLFAKRYGGTVTPAKALYQHPSIPWMVATPDFFVEGAEKHPDPGVLEAKLSWMGWRWSDQECPSEHHAQLMIQLGVCGLTHGWVAGLINADPRQFHVLHFSFDQSLFDQMAELGTQFLDFVQKDVPPDPGPGDAALVEQIVGERRGELKVDGGRLEAFEAELQAISDLKPTKAELKEQLDEVDEQIKEHENKLKLLMGPHETALMPSGTAIKVSTIRVPEKVTKPYAFTRLYIKQPIKGEL